LRTSSAIGRIAALVALVVAVVVVVILLTSNGDEYTVTAEFENASQLVKGNEVVVGGVPVGTVSAIELGSRGQAEVTFSVNDDYAPLRRGTTATVRSPSLSQIAGRQVQLTLPPANSDAAEIPDGGTLSESETVSAVDLDQLFNTLDPKTIKDFKHVIQGFEISYEGVGEQANRGYRYLNPFLSTSRRVFSELAADGPALENLVVDTSQLSGALAARAPEISALIQNLSSMMNAIGDRKQRLAEAISLLPDFMRRANTTFVNLRAALDDLDPLVSAARPAARELRPFLAELRGAAADAVPTIRDLDAILKRPGSANDLVELTGLQPELAAAAVGSGSPDCGPGAENPRDLLVAADGDYSQGAFGESVCALTNSLGNLSFFRAYTPDALGWFNTFSHIGGIDATGGAARIGLTLNAFSPSIPLLPNLANLLDPNQTLAALNVGDTQRCPGRNERPVGGGDDSVPFTDGGALTDGSHADGECDLDQGASGP
jgi:phospholipid/cholesterol/gamma-HCH transport system substrate-binding protein